MNPRPLRLLFVIGSLASGGAERQLVTLARELTARGHHVEFFTYRAQNFYQPLLDEAGIPLHCHVKQRKVSWNMVRELRGLLRNGKFDVVLSFMSGPNVWTLLAAVGLRVRPKIVVSERLIAHESVLGRSGLLSLAIIDRTYRFADHLTLNSYSQRDEYAEKYPWIRSKVSCIWNGVEMDKFQSTPLPPWQDPLQLLAVGRIAVYKNWHCLVDALAILRDEHGVQPVVRHAGKRTDLTPPHERYRIELEKRISALGLSAQWQWLGEVHTVPERLAEHHALVHPSIAEGLPNVVCEALASGRPVIIGNVLDHPRLIQDGQTGFLFDPHDPRALAEALLRLRNLSAEQAAQMGRAARVFAETHLSTQRFADEYEHLFRRLIEPVLHNT
ncbi:MAG TPA: glycosyltransferase family 4 protein [Pirellulales bacterium]|nr:glycosyltransferase family 4 protein [Pirellulales bacterium]